MRRWTWIWLAVLIATVLMDGVPMSAAAQTIRIGAVVPLTGRYAAGGAQVRAGYEIVVDDITRTGGVSVSGKKLPIELIVLDDESDATKTVSRLETLAAQGVVAYLGGFGSDLHAAAASVAEKNRIPYLGVAFALHKIHEQGFRYLFSPFWKSPDIGRELASLLESMPAAERPRTVAIFQEKTDWGREMTAAWLEAGKAAGYQVTVQGEYAPGAKDYADLILKAKGAGVDAVFGLPTPPDGMAIVKQMRELDYTPKLLLLIRAPDPPVWAKNLGKDGDDVLFAPGWHHAVKYPGVAELNAEHTKRVGRPADPITGPAYACVQILAAAISRTGALEAAKIRDAIAATDMTTVIGPVKFRPDGTGIVQSVLLQWIDGKQELVWPKEFAIHALVYPAPPFSKRATTNLASAPESESSEDVSQGSREMNGRAMRARNPTAWVAWLVALTLWLPAAVAEEAGQPALVRAVGVVALTVGNMDRSLTFYSAVLGFEKLSDVEVWGEDYERLQGVFGVRMRVVRLRLGDEQIELIEYLTPRGRPIPPDSRSNDRWFQHVAIIVSDMDRAYDWLHRHHVEHASPAPQQLPDWNPNAGGIRAFYFKDPDGHPLEVLWFPPGKGDPRWHRVTDRLFLGIDHTAIVVAETEASLACYRDTLGLRVAGASENYGPEQERLNNVFGARLRITTLRAPAGPGVELLEYLTPRDGRPRPADARGNDLLHWQTVLVVTDAEAARRTLYGSACAALSPAVVAPRDRGLGFSRGFLAQDPDGHALELIEP